jgi:hypothetical protein
MFHLDQSPIFQGLCNCFVTSAQERRADFSQRRQFGLVDVLALVLGEGKQEDGSVGTNSDNHAKAASLALSWPGDPLLDKLTAKISIDRTSHGPFDRIDEGVITNVVLPRKFSERSGLENPQRSSLVL